MKFCRLFSYGSLNSIDIRNAKAMFNITLKLQHNSMTKT